MPSGLLSPLMLADTLACVSATPLGADVDPEVNCTKAMSLSDGDSGGSSAGAWRSSGESTSDRSGQLDRAAANAGARALVVITARAPEGRRMLPARSMYSVGSL